MTLLTAARRLYRCNFCDTEGCDSNFEFSDIHQLCPTCHSTDVSRVDCLDGGIECGGCMYHVEESECELGCCNPDSCTVEFWDQPQSQCYTPHVADDHMLEALH